VRYGTPFAPWFFVSPNNSDSLPLTRSKTAEIGLSQKSALVIPSPPSISISQIYIMVRAEMAAYETRIGAFKFELYPGRDKPKEKENNQ
jgi:hypothetical protein